MLLGGSLAGWITLAAFAGLPFLLAAAVVPFRLFGVKSGALSFLAFCVAAVAAFFAFTSYFNSLGNTTIGEVTGRNESVVYHTDGSWERIPTVSVRYKPDELAPYVSEQLELTDAVYDSTHPNDFVKIRNYQSVSWKITRFETISFAGYCWDRFTQRPLFPVLAIGFVVVAFAWLVAGAKISPIVFLSGAFIVGAWWADEAVAPLWVQTAIRMSSLNTVGATVREVHRAYSGEGLRGWVHNLLYTRYNIILVEFIPLGHSDPLLALDTVDEGKTIPRAGLPITLQYSPSNPHYGVLADLSRSHYWKNALVSSLLAIAGMVFVLIVSLMLHEKAPETQQRRRRKRRSGQSGAPVAPRVRPSS